jgi:hypothetical protein
VSVRPTPRCLIITGDPHACYFGAELGEHSLIPVAGAVAIDLRDVGLIDDDASGSWQSSKPTAAHSESVRPSSGNGSIESGRRRGRTSRKREDEQGEHGDEG